MKGCLLAPFRILAAIPVILVEGFKWCRENGTKGFIVAGVFVLILAAVFGRLSSCGQKAPDLSDLATATINMPSKTDAPYYAITSDKIYYMAKYHWQTPSLLIIEHYWQVKGDRWIEYDKALSLANKPKVGKR